MFTIHSGPALVAVELITPPVLRVVNDHVQYKTE